MVPSKRELFLNRNDPDGRNGTLWNFHNIQEIPITFSIFRNFLLRYPSPFHSSFLTFLFARYHSSYSTIPIAKRRYYGRVQAAVHEFLLIGPEVVKGDMSSPAIKRFFDVNALVVVEARNQAINGQCTKKDASCKGSEIRDSFYNDMKTSMYLLGNAFRINQQKPPDSLPTVKAAKAFFKEMDAMEKRVKKGKADDKDAIGHYAAALDILDQYLDLVELPPTESNWYEQEFSRAVGASSRIT